MNKFIIGVCLLFFAPILFAQKVTVTRQQEKVKSASADVFAAALEGAKEEVNTALIKFLKDVGKTKNGSDLITISDPIFNGTAFSKKSFYASTKGDDKKTTVWLGFIKSEWEVSDTTLVRRELNQLTYQFGIKFYKDKVQAQVDETQQALDAVERQQTRIDNQGKDLTNKLSNNQQQKIQLEKQLDANKLENAVLLQKIQNNKKAQDSIANATLQIKKVMEIHKSKFREIN